MMNLHFSAAANISIDITDKEETRTKHHVALPD